MTTENQFNCIFCTECFENKEDLQIHFRRHGDPKFNQTASNNSNKLNESEVVSCDVCTEVFPTVSKAITHKHKVHPDHDAKYFCPWCGKLFTMKHLYNKHIQTTHENQEVDETCFHCDYCDVDFFVLSAMLYHNKFFHRQDTELAPIGHSKKFKMCSNEMLHLYYCPFCGEEYYNKVNLDKHMGDDHVDENQTPTEVLRCTLCDAIFHHLDAYELHLTFHSSDDLYIDNSVPEMSEFSLETVPPIMERVENDSKEDEIGGAIKIEDFLEQDLNENDQDHSNDGSLREKRKKHKKRKKSKKATITLDEFLAMNNVFGEEMDIQGIEEVPTQIVAKQLKRKSQPQTKNTFPSNLKAKLQKQGIIVKKNRSKTSLEGVKVVTKPPAAVTEPQKNIDKQNIEGSSIEKNSSNDILNKLLKQNNSQIKITKKLSPNTDLSPITSTELLERKETLEVTKKNEKLDKFNSCTSKNELQDIEGDQKDDTESQINDEKSSPSSNLGDEIQSNAARENEEASDTEIEKKVVATTQYIANPIKFNKDEILSKTDHIQTKDTCNPLHKLSPQITIKSTSLKNNPNDDILNEEKLSSEKNDNESFENDCEENKRTLHKNPITSNKSNPLEAIKHLSNVITVKSSNKNSPICTDDIKREECLKLAETENSDDLTEEIINSTQKYNDMDLENKSNSDKVNALKNLNKSITIKSMSRQHTTLVTENLIKQNKITEFSQSDNVQSHSKKVMTNETVMTTSNQNVANVGSPKLSQKQTKIPQTDNTDLIKLKSCSDILKQLPNVTAKHVSTNKNYSQPTISLNMAKVEDKNITKNQSKELEIFNIDDSDEDPDNSQDSGATSDKTQINLNESNSINFLKNLGKHITVKTNQNRTQDSHSKTNSGNTMNPDESPLQSKLKHMKGVTVKSQNSQKHDNILPSHQKVYTNLDELDFNSDPESPGNVKVSELPDDFNSSDDDKPLKIRQSDPPSSVIVQEPDDTDDENDQDNNELQDIQSEIKSSNVSTRPACLNKLQNVTIVSSRENKHSQENTIHVTTKKEINRPKFVNTTIKNEAKQVAMENINQYAGRSSTQSDQYNNINKEVTLQTFKTQTVIQEITTTVTKTIRTVNQEVRNTNTSTNRPLQVRGMCSNQVKPRFQGVNVRPAAMAPGMRIRNPGPSAPVRPVRARTNVKPCNELVPVRPNAILPQKNGPNTPSAKKTNNTNNTVVGKSLKISPNAIINSPGKTTLDTANRPFSCFKKPKESLIPGLEEIINKEETSHAASTSRKSKSISSFTSNERSSMVSSSQVQSEFKSKSEHLSKLSNLTGVKVVKSCQTQQVSKLEYTNAPTNTAKRSTLDAIEKLQKQGLLVKKPRLEENNPSEFSEHSNSDCEDFDKYEY